MKRIIALILCTFLFACNDRPVSVNAPQSNEAIFLLIENGGTVTKEQHDESFKTCLHLLQQLTKLAKRKATRDTQVHILLSAQPNRIAWSGTSRQLLEQADYIKSLITFESSFSDLVVAFEQIKTTIDLTQPDSVRLYWIGPCINVPFQVSDDKHIEVKVPQEVPKNLALGSFADRLSTLKIMRVHPDQDEPLKAYLSSIGILKRSYSGDLDFALLGVAQTRSRLKNLL
ncbi:conserved hypothetical protein [Desulfosarcina cetonica]|uniref:hypothetical protein n=1 Tax=Desulfosarcina cetonica TaxID=90730 RepID=UPI0006CF3CDD|nr:hypothetical protein [Desulfosarcina cetonica]VTR64443.1 conserved hypothetical protein [Desulfosarcina cetonica]